MRGGGGVLVGDKIYDLHNRTICKRRRLSSFNNPVIYNCIVSFKALLGCRDKGLSIASHSLNKCNTIWNYSQSSVYIPPHLITLSNVAADLYATFRRTPLCISITAGSKGLDYL